MTRSKYIIIGDGVAGATAARTIRDESKDTEITVLTDEKEPLYNRIMLKTYMKGSLPKQYTRMHDENWYEKRNINLELETKVSDINEGDQSVVTESGDTYSYDKLLVATGGNPRTLPEDEDFENVYYMWTMDDAERVKKSAEEAEKAVVIGGGLLGIDLTVAYAENDCETYYLIKDDNWWHRGLDKEGAKIIHERLENMGVNIVTNVRVEELGGDEKVNTVVLDNGEEIDEVDAVGVAIGQTPNSEIVDVEKNHTEMIKTDEYLQTSNKNIFAAGNMVEYYSPVFEKRTVNGSWDHSEEMGETAGKNMAGEKEVFDYVNTYGVGHFDAQFLAIGDWGGEPVSKKYDDSHYRRLFFDGGRLVGAVMVGYTKGQEKIKQMIHDKVEVEDREALLEKDYWE
ncbi:MAG: NAD(P)/FAD-dependent oxidoreductase [Candidatus Nanohaloarchaea archaeon]